MCLKQKIEIITLEIYLFLFSLAYSHNLTEFYQFTKFLGSKEYNFRYINIYLIKCDEK